MTGQPAQVLALSGGVGGAKLALGLDRELSAGHLHLLLNTGDDFEHLGLHISPDIDTALYTLAGLAHPGQGWGLEGATFHAMEALEALGGETWFRLGDRDLATHLWRSEQLRGGASLSEVTAALAQRLGIQARLYPMSDQNVRTTVHCAGDRLPFQHYFVRERCVPRVSGFSFGGIQSAVPAPALAELLVDTELSAIVICPSNPYVSIDPVLQVPGMWQALRDTGVPVVLVSPIVAGAALKGPAAKMMAELGVPVTATGVAQHYSERYPSLVQHFVIDSSDVTLAAEIGDLGLEVAVAPTVMKTLADKRALARFVLDLAGVAA